MATTTPTEKPAPPVPGLRDVHPATAQLLRWFEYGHLPDHLRPISSRFHALAHDIVIQCGEGPETSAGLRKLLEAKDCAVRARIAKDE